jgi:hypothetical protein
MPSVEGKQMATSPMSAFIQHLRRTLLLRDGDGITDGQLLSRYIEGRDEDAFAALVKRHGPMVSAVCRRLLPNYHDAEEAFQATFLVLGRKAATVLPREMVGNWLYGVAYMAARRGKVAAARARRRQKQVAQMPEPTVPEPDIWADLRPLLLPPRQLGLLQQSRPISKPQALHVFRYSGQGLPHCGHRRLVVAASLSAARLRRSCSCDSIPTAI